MTDKWKLKRTKQCNKCPWRKDVDPKEIPNGYCKTKHKNLKKTIAIKGDLTTVFGSMHLMSCHETTDTHCIGWLMNQLGPGNNIGMRLRMISCENRKNIKIVGEQHENFDDTIPA